ncbi:hypothetical protein NVSP9465_02262 [Novosphingobium sp. CECT 9465]|nr:hypothetical protein NVSP9465_02262 [Novosphingobium sp. CECT 9465]
MYRLSGSLGKPGLKLSALRQGPNGKALRSNLLNLVVPLSSGDKPDEQLSFAVSILCPSSEHSAQLAA